VVCRRLPAVAAIFAFGLRDVAGGRGRASRRNRCSGALGIIGLGFRLTEYVGPTLTKPAALALSLIAAPAGCSRWPGCRSGQYAACLGARPDRDSR
jgi:hypothetical protein